MCHDFDLENEEETFICPFDNKTYSMNDAVFVATKYGSEQVYKDNVDDFICEQRYGSDYYNGH